MRYLLNGLTSAALLVVSFSLLAGTAAARSCSDVTAGAQRGPEVPAVKYGGAFTLPFDDACFVQWPADNRGSAGRAADERKCRNLQGAEFLDYMPDGGRNVNICVFRPTESSSAGGAPVEDTEQYAPNPEAVTPPSPTAPPKLSSPSRNQIASVLICNKTNKKPLWVAISRQKNLIAMDKTFTTEGWWKFGEDECRTFNLNLGAFASARFYFHAHSKHRKRVWGRDVSTCVSPDVFERRDSDNYRCQGSEYLVKFTEMKVFPGKNTFNFLP